MEFHQICVLGLGYIGLPTASTFATHGLSVLGVDTNPQVVDTLRNGGLHIHEPGLRTLVQAAVNSGNLVIAETPAPSDAFIIKISRDADGTYGTDNMTGDAKFLMARVRFNVAS